MARRNTFHHGDLHNDLINLALVEIERSGIEALSLRALAAQLGVASSAPYRHFASKEALIRAVASVLQSQLYDVYRAIPKNLAPEERLRRACEAYVAAIHERPKLFQVLFADPQLTSRERSAADYSRRSALQLFVGMVCDAMPKTSEAEIHAVALACWSAIHGFAMLRIAGRVEQFGLAADAKHALLEVMMRMVKPRARR